MSIKNRAVYGDTGWSRVQWEFDMPLPEGVLLYAENAMPERRNGGPSSWRPRGRYVNSQTTALAASGIQAIGELRKTDGTTLWFAVAGGEIYATAPSVGANPFTKYIATADFAGASGGAVTFAATGLVYVVNYNGTLIFSDGTNTPFSWDGTSGGGLVKLTNCPALYGQPVVYYGKVFGIKASDRRVLVWSEEYAANTGYEAGGYNNAWTLAQTSQDPLVCLIATNQALYYFRRFGVGAITGAVTPDFASTGTLDAISYRIGTPSPKGALLGPDGSIWFSDYDDRPWRIVGTQLQPVWQQAAAAFVGRDAEVRYGIQYKATSVSNLASKAAMVYDPQDDVVICYIGNAVQAGTDSYGFVFDANSGAFYGVWENADVPGAGYGYTAFGDGTLPSASYNPWPVLLIGITNGQIVYRLKARTGSLDGNQDGGVGTAGSTYYAKLVSRPYGPTDLFATVTWDRFVIAADGERVGSTEQGTYDCVLYGMPSPNSSGYVASETLTCQTPVGAAAGTNANAVNVSRAECGVNALSRWVVLAVAWPGTAGAVTTAALYRLHAMQCHGTLHEADTARV